MITAKIHWTNFPLTYNCDDVAEVKKEFGIVPDAKGMISVVVGFDGAPSNDTLAQVKKYHSVDIYCPTQKDPGVSGNSRFDSMPVETDKLKSLTISK